MSRKPQFLCYLTAHLRHYIGAFEAETAEDAELLADSYLAQPHEQAALKTAMRELIKNGEIEVEEA
jgi:hypothetical protein